MCPLDSEGETEYHCVTQGFSFYGFLIEKTFRLTVTRSPIIARARLSPAASRLQLLRTPGWGPEGWGPPVSVSTGNRRRSCVCCRPTRASDNKLSPPPDQRTEDRQQWETGWLSALCSEKGHVATIRTKTNSSNSTAAERGLFLSSKGPFY